MLDATARKIIDRPLNWMGARLAARGVTANQVTLAGLVLGLAAAGLIGFGLHLAALLLLLASRLADGLDGAVARASRQTDFGGYLDIAADFLFYGAIPMAFVMSDPAGNGAAGAFLLTSFYFNGTSFLGFAVLAEKKQMQTDARGVKSLYFTGGLLEGTETIAFFVALCLFPAWFAPLAWIFGSLCFVTAVSRILLARRVFPDVAP
ncbi:CDP-alcohol phosphatidyltransferase family protein [Actibacterium sp. 188UL27-1]|uniref:CDP-alcohol phosphatidyltransferase family protein n=1 Tax=Actibacterium sp. 188UL27-1 TaxID=2786961 RepID=UPI00195C06B6|nr:CDP-alcohol phosphatidyltransferase family protein [Actibacterium sp. 188UL27-1]MBM7066353.1 CDP-alcohol phosphatidyltransferase family protein [Actibacterium sp. 188UL27-1]